jgi:uncharacterized membrane protein
MMQHRYSHYTYSITNKASIVLLCVLIVAGGSLFIRGLLKPGEEWVLLLAWSLWAIAFVIRLFEYLIRRYAVRQP